MTDGYDEALLLDTDGYVSEGSDENVFSVKNGKIYKPDLASCLDSITRDAVLTMACDSSIEVIEKRITLLMKSSGTIKPFQWHGC